MFRRKKKEEAVEPATEVASESTSAKAPSTDVSVGQADSEAPAAETKPASVEAAAGSEGVAAKTAGKRATSGRGNRVQKIGIVPSDKMQKRFWCGSTARCCIRSIAVMLSEGRS